MRTIYVSDLDGTLLDSSSRLPKKAEARLREMISRGLDFTVATGRTPASAVDLVRGIGIKLPMILMNGAMIYDPIAERPAAVYPIDRQSALRLAYAEELIGIGGYYITGDMDGAHLHYGSEIRDRVERDFGSLVPGGVNGAVEHMPHARARDLAHCGMMQAEYVDSSPEKIERLAYAISNIPGITCAMYKDRYESGRWCLEATSSSTSKGTGVRHLREITGADRVVCFGDGRNDLPFFAECDESYAVAGAWDELKAAATGSISSNDELGVVRFLEGIAI